MKKKRTFKDEAEFEQFFVEQIENAGGKCIKCNPMKMGKGIPDRLVCFNDTFGLVELKNTHGTGVVTPEQNKRLQKFRDNGVKSYVVDSVEDISKVIFEIKNYKKYRKKSKKLKESAKKSKREHKRIGFLNKRFQEIKYIPFYKELQELEVKILKKDPYFFQNNKGFKTCWDFVKYWHIEIPTIPLINMKRLAEDLLYNDEMDVNLIDWSLE